MPLVSSGTECKQLFLKASSSSTVVLDLCRFVLKRMPKDQNVQIQNTSYNVNPAVLCTPKGTISQIHTSVNVFIL